jgi:hypothetical protein
LSRPTLAVADSVGRVMHNRLFIFKWEYAFAWFTIDNMV